MSVKISVSSGRFASSVSEASAVIVSGKKLVSGGLSAKQSSLYTSLMRTTSFSGDFGACKVVPVQAGLPGTTAVFLGVGSDESHEQMAESLRRAAGSMVRSLEAAGVRKVTVNVIDVPNAAAVAAAVAEGSQLAAYAFTEHSPRRAKEYRESALKEVHIVVNAEDERAVKQAVTRVKQVDAGVSLARDLVNEPPHDMSPARLVAEARAIADASPYITLSTYDRAQAERAGFTAFLAVAKGSDLEPHVIHLQYEPKNPTGTVAVVGKGITFDSGGLSLKPAQFMETMKCDMAGAATVLGLFRVLSHIKPHVAVHGIIAACENMPSGTAYRPGDVVESRNGTTIEIRNTDAEGRVTLADALSYAVDQKPDAIVDLATLTGACVVGLGESVAGLFSNDDVLASGLKQSAESTGEQVAQLPLPSEYVKQIRSDVADIRNDATTRYGGAITAALFLREFVGETPWAHIDIAGPSFMETSVLPYYRVGGTGFGVRLLSDFLTRDQALFEQKSQN